MTSMKEVEIMENISLYYFLAGAVLLVFFIELLVNRQLHLSIWKIVIFTAAIVPIGAFCGKLMRLIEAGTWIGVSYYGALLIAPLPMIIVGILLKMKPVETLMMCAPAGCIALVFMKIQCIITGCCYGRILWYQDNGRPLRFPSQIVEMLVGIILLFVIMKIIKSENHQKYVYAWFLLLYGSTRFFLNLLRDTEPFVLGMSAGCFWSLISCIIGGGLLYYKFGFKAKKKAALSKL